MRRVCSCSTTRAMHANYRSVFAKVCICASPACFLCCLVSAVACECGLWRSPCLVLACEAPMLQQQRYHGVQALTTRRSSPSAHQCIHLYHVSALWSCSNLYNRALTSSCPKERTHLTPRVVHDKPVPEAARPPYKKQAAIHASKAALLAAHWAPTIYIEREHNRFHGTRVQSSAQSVLRAALCTRTRSCSRTLSSSAGASVVAPVNMPRE
jgi:hypothetical protein